MLSEARISMIQQFKGAATYSIAFIRNFDREWDAVVDNIKNSGADLGKIRITAKHTEYKNVRT